MARKRGGKAGKMFKLGNLNLLGIGFFFVVIYFSATVNGFIQSTWLSLNLPHFGGYTTIVFAALTATIFYIIAKQLMAAKILRL